MKELDWDDEKVEELAGELGRISILLARFGKYDDSLEVAKAGEGLRWMWERIDSNATV